MKTILSADGTISIPKQIQDADQLAPGDSFELERVGPGQYLLAKRTAEAARVTIATEDDGLPVIRTTSGIITSRLVKQIETLTP